MKIQLPFRRAGGYLLTAAMALTLVSAESGLVNLVIKNNSGHDIYYLYCSSSESTEWGDDLLGSEVISNGEEFSLLVNANTYDIKIIDNNSRECISYGVSIQGNTTWNVSPGDWERCAESPSSTNRSSASPVSFSLRNSSSWDIYYIYMSLSDEAWGEDHLESEVLSVGETFTLNITPGTYDIKLIDEDSDECVKFGVEVTSNTSFVIDDNFWLGCITEN